MTHRIDQIKEKVIKRSRVLGLGKAIYWTGVEKIHFNSYKKKIYNFLEKFFNEELTQDQSELITRLEECDYRYVFVCWWQGVDKAPLIVRKCMNSIKEFCANYEARFILIDKNNYSEWVDFPSYICSKIGKEISITEFSDLLRMSLLRKYGGLWIDSTIYYSGKSEMEINPFELDFFSQKHDRYPDHRVNVSDGKWASYIQGTKYKNFPLYVLAEKMYIHYYNVYDTNIDYFVVDYIMRLCYEHYPIIKEYIDNLRPNNTQIFWLYKNAYSVGLGSKFSEIKKSTVFHKLNWRLNIDTGNHTLISDIFSDN